MTNLGTQNGQLVVKTSSMRLTTDNGGLPLMCCCCQSVDSRQ
ncbi:hypothetical protein N692_11850 [Lactiplantibacillus plantarum EGD-AQ4]|nr:hypothetical protein N692_11850 [Lactiplantibacillus plantarum EGD-AQ4]